MAGVIALFRYDDSGTVQRGAFQHPVVSLPYFRTQGQASKPDIPRS